MSMSWVKIDQTEVLKISRGLYLRHVITSHFSGPRGENIEGRGYRKGIIDNNFQGDLIQKERTRRQKGNVESEKRRKKWKEKNKTNAESEKKLALQAGAAQGDVLSKPGLLSSTDVKDCSSKLAILLPCNPHWGIVWKMLRRLNIVGIVA